MKPRLLACLLAWAFVQPAMAAPALPPALVRQLPRGFVVLGSADVAVSSIRRFRVVALGARNESGRKGAAPARPLLIFQQRADGRFDLKARNDAVVLRADQGGQCDPFLDGEATIAAKGRYFTVEHGVACGQHWTDYITFRFDDRLDTFVFDNRRSESWSMNPSTAPDAEALVLDGPARLERARTDAPVPFARWRPAPR